MLRNLSKHDISLTSVKAEGLDLQVPLVNRIVIAPGSTAHLRYETTLPETPRHFTLTAEFIRESAVISRESRTFAFQALPRQEALPGSLRYPAGDKGAEPARARPLRAFLNAAATAASIAFATFSVGMILKGKPN